MDRKLRSDKAWLFWRIYGIVAIFSIITGLYIAITHIGPEQSIMFLIFVILLPLLLPFSSFSVFTWNYSGFGKYEKTPFPNKAPIFEKIVFSMKVGWWGYFTKGNWSGVMYVFEEGVGILFKLGYFGSGLDVGRVFIPVENVISLKKLILGYELKHNSPELWSFVYFNNQEVAERIESIIKDKKTNINYETKIVDGKVYKVHK